MSTHMSHLNGLISAPFTPMHPDGTINFSKVPDVVNLLIDNKVKGMFVCGSTGEGPSLTTEERKQLAEAFVKAANKRLLVFVHVGHNSITEARQLAAHAQQIGADYISATPSTYFKVDSIDLLVACLQEIAEGAPALPLYYYNIPALTGISLDMVKLLEKAGDAIPSFAGIKYTAPLIHDYQACVNFNNNKYDILYGTDEMLLGALATGAKGFIGSTYNFVAPLYNALMEEFKKGNLKEAQRLQYISVEMVRVIVKYGGLRAQKAMMKLIGCDCGNVRYPLNPFKENEYKLLEADLRKIGFFDWICKPKAATVAS
ncbi:dihydrodipicolinate synthase family protein [Longitalea luteola]|uniref:dihydrodipicolinate synthase family protein n=1 Tax=Longitalea luteola TaxID=2812563 RepID=UPI001A957C5F|nr:dihydrodipicolinate synthase family protein [Longitalea luteola]